MTRHPLALAVLGAVAMVAASCSGGSAGDAGPRPTSARATTDPCTTAPTAGSAVTAATTVAGARADPAASTSGAPATVGPAGGPTVPADLTRRPTFPLRQIAGERYLTDASGQPFLMVGDAAWSMIAELRRDEVDLYLADRRARGFNTLLVSLLEHAFATKAPANIFGDAPFTRPGDYTAPNEAYFAHADWVLRRASEEGFLVLLTPSYTGFKDTDHGWWEEMKAAGADALRGYGRFVAARYAALDNIVWVQGGDSDPPDKELIDALAAGIAEGDPGVLQTAHTAPESAPLDYWAGRDWMAINNLYTYEDVYAGARREYDRVVAPFFMMESTYEKERPVSLTRIRTQGYHAVLTGAFGHVFGNNPIWHFSGPGLAQPESTWQESLDSPGSRAMAVQGELLRSLPWWKLVPDHAGVDILAGDGGDGDGRTVAARVCDGSLAVAYVPRRRSIELDLTRFSRPTVTFTWIDPTTGERRPAPSPTTGGVVELPTPGDNAEGDADWVLLAEVG